MESERAGLDTGWRGGLRRSLAMIQPPRSVCFASFRDDVLILLGKASPHLLRVHKAASPRLPDIVEAIASNLCPA